MTAKEYTERVKQALQEVHQTCHLYTGVEGAKRIAREYGAGLVDSNEKEALQEIRNSYIMVCVQGYWLKPPIDAKVWMKEVQESYQKQKNARRQPSALI